MTYSTNEYQVTTVGEYLVLRTHNYGYTYILSYNPIAGRYVVVSTTNRNIYPKQ